MMDPRPASQAALARHEPAEGDPPIAVPRAFWRVAGEVALRAVYVGVALAIFVFALRLLQAGAAGLRPVLDGLDISGTANAVGLGWLGSYIVLSGSPVAAISLSLFSEGVINDTETFAMINGSRMGASFIVLFVGFLYWVTGRRNPDGLYIGVVALLTAFTLWGPVIPLGQFLLERGWFDDVRFGSPGAVTSIVSTIYDPLIDRIDAHAPKLLMFAGGIGILLLSFSVFDRVLPNLDQPGPRFERASAALSTRFPMFGFGLLVTAMTLSVSLSLTILVPLTLKGYVRRDSVIPYVMGANIATWIDTLFAALLLDEPRAFTIVFVEMITGAAVSLIVLVFLYGPYQRAIHAGAHLATRDRRGFMLFMAAILIVPALLLLV